MSDVATDPSDQAKIRPAYPPLTSGKVALWLFLATEVMFFTGLIGTYIVLRAGSPSGSYSNLFPPGTDLSDREGATGLVLKDIGQNREEVETLLEEFSGHSSQVVEEQLHTTPTVIAVDSTYGRTNLGSLQEELDRLGASTVIVELESYRWPMPYNTLVNPLSIDLTALNTFILICSSVSMVFALAAIQRGDRRMLSVWLFATMAIGSVFLSIQAYEYINLAGVIPPFDLGFIRIPEWTRNGEVVFSGFDLSFIRFPGAEGSHYHSTGVSENGNFQPGVSLFASAFYTMTGFHGAHVTGGVIALFFIWLGSLFGFYSKENHAPVELVGLYWHFVDLVWILLFTVVYLV